MKTINRKLFKYNPNFKQWDRKYDEVGLSIANEISSAVAKVASEPSFLRLVKLHFLGFYKMELKMRSQSFLFIFAVYSTYLVTLVCCFNLFI